MFEFDPKEYAGASLRTVPEKVLHCRLQAVGQILSLVISGVFIILTIIALNYFSYFAIINLLIATILSLLFSIFLIYWGFSSARLLRESTDLYQGNVRPFMTLIALVGGMLFCGIYEVYIFIGWFFRGWFIDNQTAQASNSATAQNVANWTEYFNNFFMWYIILAAVQFFLFMYSAFAAYICIPGEATLRRIFALANLGLCALSAIIFYLCYVCYDYLSLGEVANLPPKLDVDIMWWLALVTLIISLVAILVNLRRSKVLYFIVGAALVAASFASVTEAPKVLRLERHAYSNTFPSCQKNMQYIHRDFIQSNLGCPTKYLSTQTCAKNQLAYVWEDDQNKDANSKAYASACLNSQCCGAITNSMLGPFAKLGTWGLFYVVSVAVTCGIALMIADRQGIIQPNTNKLIELVSAGLQFLVLLLLLILILTRSSNSPSLNPTFGLQQTATATNTFLPLPVEGISNSPCLALKSDAAIDAALAKLTAPTTCPDDPGCANTGIRVGVFTPGPAAGVDEVQFYLPPGYRSHTVRILDPIALRGSAAPKATDPSLYYVVEGKKDDVKKFFANDFRVCLAPSTYENVGTPTAAPKITFGAAYINLVNSQKDAGTATAGLTASTDPLAAITPDAYATVAPFKDLDKTYKIYGVLTKVVYDVNGNAQLQAFQSKAASASAAGSGCTYNLQPIGYPYNEDFATIDAPKTTGFFSLPLDGTKPGAFAIEGVRILPDYRPYYARLFFYCTNAVLAGTALDTEKSTIYENYVDIRIGGYPRLSSQDVGVVTLKTRGFKQEAAALVSRRVRVLEHIKITNHINSHVRAGHVRQTPAPAAGGAATSVAVDAAALTTYKYPQFAQPQGQILFKSLDASTNQALTNTRIVVKPAQAYDEKLRVAKGENYAAALKMSRNYKDLNNRITILASTDNATVHAAQNPGILDIQAVHYLDQPDGNYHNYTYENRFLYNGKNPAYLPYTIPLVPKAFNNTIRVLLEWGSQVLDLDLVVVFNLGGKQSCMVGSSYASCGGATFGADNYNGSEYGGELLSVDVRKYTYLFYVKRFAGGNTSPRVGLSLKSEPYYSNPTNAITDSFARVSVYVPNFDKAVFTFPVPGLNAQTAANTAGYPVDANKVVDKSKLTWMAFCMKGEIGPRSIIPLQTFWSNTDSTLQAPSPAACDKAYADNKLTF